jgi:plasmid replication initiation protein
LHVSGECEHVVDKNMQRTYNQHAMKKSLVVTQSNDLIMAQYSMGLLAKKMFAMSVAKLNPQGGFLKSKFNLKEFRDLLDTDDPNIYSKIHNAAVEVTNIPIKFTDNKGKKVLCWAFSQVTIDPKSRDVEILFPPALKDHLLDLQEKYTSYLLQNVVNLSNPLHIRLFEILKSKSIIKTWTFDLADLFTTLELPKSYSNYANLEKYFLKPAQEALSKLANLGFDYEPIKVGKKVVKIKFYNIKYSGQSGIPVVKQILEDKPVDPDPKFKPTDHTKEVYEYYCKIFNKNPNK